MVRYKGGNVKNHMNIEVGDEIIRYQIVSWKPFLQTRKL